MSKRSDTLPPGNWKRVSRIKIDPPARLSCGPIVVENILRQFYLHKGQVRRRKEVINSTLRWSEPVNRMKGIS